MFVLVLMLFLNKVSSAFIHISFSSLKTHLSAHIVQRTRAQFKLILTHNSLTLVNEQFNGTLNPTISRQFFHTKIIKRFAWTTFEPFYKMTSRFPSPIIEKTLQKSLQKSTFSFHRINSCHQMKSSHLHGSISVLFPDINKCAHKQTLTKRRQKIQRLCPSYLI